MERSSTYLQYLSYYGQANFPALPCKAEHRAYIEIKNPNILYYYFNVYKNRTVVHRVTWLTPEAQSNISFGSLDIFSTHDRLTMNYWLKFKD